jgi:hypothetical protein
MVVRGQESRVEWVEVEPWRIALIAVTVRGGAAAVGDDDNDSERYEYAGSGGVGSGVLGVWRVDSGLLLASPIPPSWAV